NKPTGLILEEDDNDYVLRTNIDDHVARTDLRELVSFALYVLQWMTMKYFIHIAAPILIPDVILMNIINHAFYNCQLNIHLHAEDVFTTFFFQISQPYANIN
ncbi:hypothetical protein L9F63_013767, partial [Diploptera punctata]